ncbi:hypothetical protein NHX12_031805 [Muraenolepis orangiensis]|uniref:Uncharacterized protein n=1 Tax=Muraenolepis orangiensis TaxID=630683 RepID=A0A9Q0E8J0_9TELE|nr:hypothetical protein NHX12_031805 [Muraenolepis orangiensis]
MSIRAKSQASSEEAASASPEHLVLPQHHTPLWLESRRDGASHPHSSEPGVWMRGCVGRHGRSLSLTACLGRWEVSLNHWRNPTGRVTRRRTTHTVWR